MSEINYLEVIQNKLDALVDKIVQKENSDENFRITYAQILEKINTKMDVFSSSEDYERIALLTIELKNLFKDRQEVVDGKFNAIKSEFENLNEVLINSLKTPELLAAFNKIQNQIHYFAEEQENQKFAFNSIVSHIEKFGTLEETNDNMIANFAIVKEQNTIINENVNKQIDFINKINEDAKNADEKSIEAINKILFELKDFSGSLNDDNKEIKNLLNEKVDSAINKIQEINSFIDMLNSNLTTLIQVVGNIFEEEDFIELKSDIADILIKTALTAEAIKSIATKEELFENSTKNKDEIKKYNKELVENLEINLLSKIDLSELANIKNFTEKMFFQGTEVLKEEIWEIKDTINTVQENALTIEAFKNENSGLKEEIIDAISEESVATSNQITNISSSLENTKSEIIDVVTEESVSITTQVNQVSSSIEYFKNEILESVSEESTATTNQIGELSSTIESLKKDISEIILNEQNEQITETLNNLQAKFTTQLIQIADNISFTEEAEEINENMLAVSDEIKEKISSDITEIEALLGKIDNAVSEDINKDLKTLIAGFKLLTSGLNEDQNYVYTLPDIESDLTKIRLDINNIQKVLISDDESETKSNDIATKLNNIKEKIENIENSPLNNEIIEVKYLFNSLGEDISSISKRTNKLILASDEVNKILKNNINTFTELLNSFDKHSNEFYNSAFMNELNIKVEKVSRATSSIQKSDQVMHEAFMYLAEWVDSTTESFNEIKDDVAKIKRNLLSDEETAAEKLARIVKALSQKVEEQDAKIDLVDEKLNRILAQQNETKELKSLVEYVASQVSITNEKMVENDKLAQLITSMEKQLKKIEKNVSAITEYLDEEDDQDYEEE